MQDERDDDGSPSDAPGVGGDEPQLDFDEDELERTDTAVTTIIRGESVSIPTPAWGTAIAVDDEVIIAELVDDETGSTPIESIAAGDPLMTPTGSILIPEPSPPRPPVLGAIAVLAAIATAVLHALAVNTAAAGDPDQATVLAWVSIGLSCGAIVFGVLAAALRSGRIIGLIAAVVALFANPWILLKVLQFFSQ